MWLTEIYYNLSTREASVLGACLSIYRTGLKFYGYWDRIGFYKKNDSTSAQNSYFTSLLLYNMFYRR
jgi:hypothetical protein